MKMRNVLDNAEVHCDTRIRNGELEGYYVFRLHPEDYELLSNILGEEKLNKMDKLGMKFIKGREDD